MLPFVSATDMTRLLDELAPHVPPGTHPAVLIDNAGWHIAAEVRVPSNITPVHLPRYTPS